MRTGTLSVRHRFIVRLILPLFLLGSGLLAPPGRAAELPASVLAAVPPALQPWVDWVLRDRPERRCPVNYEAVDRRQCVWLSALTLDLDARGGEFGQQVRSDSESWLTLPGDRRHWPQDVRLDEQPIPVLERNGRPALKAFPGEHRISGRFVWRALPDSIRVPPANALLELRIDGRPVTVSRLEDDGVLWLRQRPTEPAQQDDLDLQVFRLLTDGIPFAVVTRLDLRVSGQAREEVLGPVLLPDFLPLALDSPLPARLEPDGRLRVQLRPGSWTISLTARHRGPVDALAWPAVAPPWPQQEIWSFQAQNLLRVVQVGGAPALDPAQTNLPAEWRQWPAYLAQPGDTLRFVTRTRGDTETAPERLTLERTLWLDFAGGGYTAQDRLSGSLNRTRLEAAPALRLGRVEINGEDQFITQLPEAGTAGVEVRQLNDLRLVADSRLEPAAIDDLPAVGWRIAPQSIGTTLNLPPGWRLLAASGPDSAGNAWLYSWNLLDLFVVLVITFGFAKLWDWRWGIVALFGMALSYHEANAPLYVWLNVLAAVALLRVLPPGRFRAVVNLYRRLALLALLVIGALFAVQQVRSALYPQLEPFAFGALLAESDRVMRANAPIPQALDEIQTYNRAPASVAPGKGDRLKKLQQQYTPDIKVQTGPGLPVWNWQRATLRWNGPVATDERLRLWLLPPWGTRILLLVGLTLLLAMGARVFIAVGRKIPPASPPPFDKGGLRGISSSPSFGKGEQGGISSSPSFEKGGQGGISSSPPFDKGGQGGISLPPGGSVAVAVLSLLLAAPLLGTATAARAELPSPALLEELRARLTEPPDCQRCGDLAALRLALKGDELKLRLSLQAQVDAAVPLPLPREGLIVRAVELDGQAAILYRDPAQLVWLRLPAGLHELTVAAAVPESVAALQLPLPMTPGRVELDTDGWLVEGYVEGRADRQLQLTRQRPTAATPLQAGAMPPFVRVERDLVLDVDWRVETRVRRLSQADSAAVVEIPLLPGERVTTPDIRVRDGRVLLNLPPDRTEIAWSATLSRNDSLPLQAAERVDFVEVWHLRAGPLWHVQSAGIPLVRRVDAEGQWLPEWRPWPGERVTLTVGRPEGAPGGTATIDRSELRLNPGQRLSEATLEMTVRASRGADQTVTLPSGAVLTGVRINDVQQPLRQQGQQVVLPLTPGVQRVVLVWRNEQGIGVRYTTPVVNLGGPSVNSTVSVNLPRNRWVLLAGGPVMGPAVLFWGVLLVMLAGAVVLKRVGGTPLRVHHWFLLGVGLSQSHILAILVVAGWLLLLAWRKTRVEREMGALRFNLLQLALALLTLAAGAALLGAIEQGLLGPPDMRIAGNDSSAWRLNWYQDRVDGPLPTAWVISAPMLLYRGLMLAWALWLALAVLKWLGWAWDCFSTGGLWRRWRRRKGADAASSSRAGGSEMGGERAG